jgi:hypothetical protein
MLDRDPEVQKLLDVLATNTGETGSGATRLRRHADTIFRCLASALKVDEDRLRSLANDRSKDAAMERAYQRRLMFVAAIDR